LIEDREFEIGGEIFKWRYPYWEETAAIYDEDVATIGNGNGEVDISTKQAMELTIKRMEMFLDPEGESIKRWRALTKRKENPIPLHLYGDLYRWLLEVTSGRPTTALSTSEPGPGSTEVSSPGKSS
jgi:hypothetical protein